MITKNSSEVFGSRILLTKFQDIDVDQQYIDWLNDPEVVRYSNQRFHKHTFESCEQYRRTFDIPGKYFFSVSIIDTKQKIGTVTAYTNTDHGTADLGILIGEKSVWGRGYGIDAWETLARWVAVEHGVRKITGGALARNKAMIKIFQKSNFHLETVQRNQEIYYGMSEDILLYAKFIK